MLGHGFPSKSPNLSFASHAYFSFQRIFVFSYFLANNSSYGEGNRENNYLKKGPLALPSPSPICDNTNITMPSFIPCFGRNIVMHLGLKCPRIFHWNLKILCSQFHMKKMHFDIIPESWLKKTGGFCERSPLINCEFITLCSLYGRIPDSPILFMQCELVSCIHMCVCGCWTKRGVWNSRGFNFRLM